MPESGWLSGGLRQRLLGVGREFEWYRSEVGRADKGLGTRLIRDVLYVDVVALAEPGLRRRVPALLHGLVPALLRCLVPAFLLRLPG